MFEIAKQLSQHKTKELIEQFQLRPTGSKMTESFGYTAIQTVDGLSFIQTNTARYNPEKNLVNILFEIEKILKVDKYTKGEITLERTIPPVWLSIQEDKQIQNLLLKSAGCISLQMNLKPEYHLKANMQVLYVYLVENKDIENARVLNRKVDTTKPDGFARLGFSEEKIFCLLIQRTLMANDNEFETNKSLLRFEKSIKKIIKQA